MGPPAQHCSPIGGGGQRSAAQRLPDGFRVSELSFPTAGAALAQGVGFPLTSAERELEQKTSSASELIK